MSVELHGGSALRVSFTARHSLSALNDRAWWVGLDAVAGATASGTTVRLEIRADAGRHKYRSGKLLSAPFIVWQLTWLQPLPAARTPFVHVP